MHMETEAEGMLGQGGHNMTIDCTKCINMDAFTRGFYFSRLVLSSQKCSNLFTLLVDWIVD